MRLPAIAASALLLLPLPACDLLDALDEPAGCLPAPAELDLTGGWWISGHGDRRDCDDELDDGSIDFETPRAVAIRQACSNGTLSSTLALESPGAVGQFTFDGRIDGDCVTFTTAEGGGADQSFEFTGTADGSYTGSSCPVSSGPRTVRGEFRSEGPGSCVTSGTFKVEIR